MGICARINRVTSNEGRSSGRQHEHVFAIVRGMSSQPALRLSHIASELGISTARQLSNENSLPVANAFREVFPHGLRRGSTISVDSTSVLLLLLSAATQAGSWAAVAGFPTIGIVAAKETGVALERCAFVPHFTENSATKVIATLVDSVDFVVVHRCDGVRAADTQRLIARARERKCVLVLSKTSWRNVTPLTLRTSSSSWEMTANGRGRLKGRWVGLTVSGRAAMSRPTHASVWLGDGAPCEKTLQFRSGKRSQVVG
jgi:hypothetical protein